MGLAASIFQSSDQEIKSTKSTKAGKKAAGTKAERKQRAEERAAALKKIEDDHRAELLDDAFFLPPVRSSTLEAAALYPSDFPDRPGLMPGSHKHLGGAYDPTDGCIYGVPASSKAVLVMHPTKEGGCYKLDTIPLPKHIQKRPYKWLRGIVHDGYLWAIPSWANAVLCVDIDAHWGRRPLPEGQTDVVNLIPLPEEHPDNMEWQWHGASMNMEKTHIYCIPSNAEKVLVVDVQNKTTSFIDIEYDQEKYPEFSPKVTNCWYGGIAGKDNAVYGMPYRAAGVLRIDCNDNTAKLIGPNYGVGKYFWHGGIQINGKIYAHPSHAPDTVLVVDTNVDKRGEVTELPIHRAEYDKDPRNNYKWLGGAVGADGHIYCPACDTSSILKINATTDHCETFGFVGKEKNKWQGGILGRDNCIYTIPADGTHICRILTDPSVEGENPYQLLGGIPAHKDKWQGAGVGKDGSLYFVPENGYRVMRVTPPEDVPKLINGKLPEGDVKIELM